MQWSYWWYFSAIGCFIPYVALYFRDLRLSGLQIGILMAILPVGTAFLAPLWGSLADAWSAHRLILRMALALAALAALLLTQATTFPTILLWMTLLAVCAAGIPALLDSYAMMISEREGQPYGRLRVWGSFGFIVAVWLVGWLMGEAISTIFLAAYALSLLFAGIASLGLPPLRPRAATSMRDGVREVVRSRPVALLLLTGFLVTSNASMLPNFFSVYLVEIGGTTQLVGTASALSAISELPVLIFGAWLLDRFTSQRMLLLAIAVYVVRFALYALPPTPFLALGVQLLHGLSFGAYLMASVTLIHQYAGRERAATAQGLLASTSFGFGSITGSLVGGSLLDRLGAVGVFRVAAIGMLVALLVYWFGARLVAARESVARRHESGARLAMNNEQ